MLGHDVPRVSPENLRSDSQQSGICGHAGYDVMSAGDTGGATEKQ